MTTDTEDDGFTTIHQSAAFAGAGAGGVVRPDLPLTLSAAQAEIVTLRGHVAELEGALVILCENPAAVHINMLRGNIAKLTWAQIEHLYPEQVRALTNGGRDE